MTEDIRIPIPLLGGEYNPPLKIQSHAQMLFLDVVLKAAPAPLYFLRDEILPKYQTAFSIEQKPQLPVVDLSNLSVRAVVDQLYIRAMKGVKLPPEVRKMMKERPLVYEAAAALIGWSEKFNLKGNRCGPIAADEGDIREPELQHRCWPIVAALKTILFWHFHPIGWIWKRKNPPHWCPPVFTLQDPVPEPQVLPPVQLRMTVPDETSKSTFLEVDAPGWYIGSETEVQFRGRINESFGRWLDDYVAERTKEAYAAGFEKTPGKRKLLLHFEWVAKFQIDKMSPGRLARIYKAKEDTVDDGIQSALDLIYLQRRAPTRGGLKGTKHSSSR